MLQTSKHLLAIFITKAALSFSLYLRFPGMDGTTSGTVHLAVSTTSCVLFSKPRV